MDTIKEMYNSKKKIEYYNDLEIENEWFKIDSWILGEFNNTLANKIKSITDTNCDFYRYTCCDIDCLNNYFARLVFSDFKFSSYSINCLKRIFESYNIKFDYNTSDSYLLKLEGKIKDFYEMYLNELQRIEYHDEINILKRRIND